MKNKSQIEVKKSLYFIVVGIISTVIIGLLLFLFASQSFSSIPKGFENFIITERFFVSCFNYRESEFIEDAPDLIDWENFHDGSLNKCYESNMESSKQFRLTLVNLGNNETQVVITKLWRGEANDRDSHNVKIFRNGKIVEGKLHIDSK